VPFPSEGEPDDQEIIEIVQSLQSGYKDILKGYCITLQKAMVERLHEVAETLGIYAKDENTENRKQPRPPSNI